MEEKDIQQIPYIVYEASEARAERRLKDFEEKADKRHKRVIIALIISIILIFVSNAVSNAIWACVWYQYDYSSDEVVTKTTVDGKNGIANYIGNNGDINNGKNSSSEASAD